MQPSPYSEIVSSASVAGFIRPDDLETALAAISDGAVPVSGGTDVMLRRATEPVTLVDLMVLPLAGISGDGRGWTVGANATLTEVLEHPELSQTADGTIARMLRVVGSPLLRNRATIGGHLARGRLSDVIPVLLALDATITWYEGREYTADLADFYRDEVQRRPIIITRIGIPRPAARSGAAFRKFSRTHFDLAILNAACRIDRAADDTVARARVVVGETPALATSLPGAEAELVGRALSAHAIAAAAHTAAAEVSARRDDRASAEYRRTLTQVLVRRCLEEIGGRWS